MLAAPLLGRDPGTSAGEAAFPPRPSDLGLALLAPADTSSDQSSNRLCKSVLAGFLRIN